MAVRIQFRRGTAAEWTSANPTLAAGELGYETDTAKTKVGDGTTLWSALPYAGVNQDDINAAVANVIDLAPGTLDTLNEIAAAIGDDADFINTINSTIQTVESNASSYANTAASSAQANAQSYADSAVAALVDSSPGTLDTLNELAAALGDDPSFATTIATNLSTKMEFVADTSANFAAANVLTTANTLYVELDTPGYVRIGDGVTNYNDLAWAGKPSVDAHNLETINVHGIPDTSVLVVQSQLDTVDTELATHLDATLDVHGIANTALLATTTDVSAHADATTNVHGILDTSVLVVTSDLGGASSTELGYTAGVTSGIQAQLNAKSPIESPTFTGTVVLPATTSIDAVSATEISYLDGVTSGIQGQIDAKAPIADPTLTGTVVLPTTTSIGTVDSAEIGYLDGVTSAIQTQINAKLATAAAASTYAPLVSPTFTGTVVLPADTSIDGVSSLEISYLNNVSSAIQTQIDAKAPIESPTFTGTVAGITKTMVGLNNVNNTADANKPISIATQAALDAKAALAGAVFTGNVEAADVTVTGNLYVQGATTTVSTSNLSLRDNMLYLNQAGLFTLTDAAGDGTNVIYTVDTTHDLSTGDFITVTGVTPSSFDISGEGLEILATTSNTITVASTVTDTYTSGGSLRGKVHSNPDLGWAAGRYDVVNGSGYAHAGIFRDASDGVFKFFDGYTPEPDESVFIDTTHASFALTSIEVAGLITESVTFADGSVQTAAGVASITGFTEKTASYQLDTLDHKDNVVEMNSASATTFTIPLEATTSWPVGASMDIIQTGAGQVTIDIEAGGVLNYTPGNKLRTQWSSCTIMKRSADSWILYGDLTA